MRKIYGVIAGLAFLGMFVAECTTKQGGQGGAGVLPAAACLAVMIYAARKAGMFCRFK